MVKRLLVAMLVGGVLLLGAPTSASADGKADRHESRHGDEGDDESDDGFRFWDYYWHPGYFYGSYYDSGCYPFYGKWRSHRFHHRFYGFGEDEENGDEESDGIRSFIFDCGYPSRFGFRSGYRSCYRSPLLFGRDRGYYGYEAMDHESCGYSTHEAGGYGTSSFVANMTSDQEVPPVAGAGQGTAYVDVDAAIGRVCYSLAPSGISQPTAAHIHQGSAGTTGPVVVALSLAGGNRTCAAAERTVLQEIAANPGGFYVNVHTVDYPDGAIRGQLAPRPLS